MMGHFLVTGAAKGLGQALAESLLAKGHQVTGIDINTPGWPAENPTDFSFLQADLSALANKAALLDQLNASTPFDGVIHCAGINATGPFEQMAHEKIDQLFAINLLAPIKLTNHLIAHNKLNQNAILIWIASLSHLTSYPGAVAYAASKDGLMAYAKNFARAHKSTYRSMSVLPGPLNTDHAREHAPSNNEKDIARRLSPQKAAEYILADAEKSKQLSVPGTNAKLIALLAKWAPGLIEKIIHKQLYLPLREKSR